LPPAKARRQAFSRTPRMRSRLLGWYTVLNPIASISHPHPALLESRLVGSALKRASLIRPISDAVVCEHRSLRFYFAVMFAIRVVKWASPLPVRLLNHFFLYIAGVGDTHVLLVQSSHPSSARMAANARHSSTAFWPQAVQPAAEGAGPSSRRPRWSRSEQCRKNESAGHPSCRPLRGAARPRPQ
jgi:hypothetical protein